MNDDHEDLASSFSIVAFRCSPELRALIEQRAADEGLSYSAVARRACLRDLARAKQPEGAH